MKPHWMIQTDIEGVDTESMIAEVKAQGMVVVSIEHHLGAQVDFSVYDSNDCVICYGDIDFVRQVRRTAPFIPGAWCNFDNMKCNTYYTYFGEYLLNDAYHLLPACELLRKWYKFKLVCSFDPPFPPVEKPPKALFVRPNSGAKPFTGFVVDREDKHKIESLVQSIGVETLVLVAPAKDITAEWRFVICDRKVVAGCRYPTR